MKCEKFKECGREVYYDATGLCLAHEKERRKRSAAATAGAETKAAARKTARKRPTAATRKTTEARTQTSRPATETRA